MSSAHVVACVTWPLVQANVRSCASNRNREIASSVGRGLISLRSRRQRARTTASTTMLRRRRSRVDPFGVACGTSSVKSSRRTNAVTLTHYCSLRQALPWDVAHAPPACRDGVRSATAMAGHELAVCCTERTSTVVIRFWELNVGIARSARANSSLAQQTRARGPPTRE